ncbi:unnamed protein product [Caenorhabditis sp. 36 PRJEB53466]|nr:unnamed protein product [Caenorhabditis sp. 36 PRJEB53466]
MKRVHSELYAPYRSLGVVTGDVSPSVRSVFVGKKSTLSILCPVDNIILHYNAEKLRIVGMSNPLSDKVIAVSSSSSCVYAAYGSKVSSLPFCREVKSTVEVPSPIKIMTLIGDKLIAVDRTSGINVIETTDNLTPYLFIEGGNTFEITSIVHPSTYLNKIVVASKDGRLRIVNIRTGRVVHEFSRNLGSSVTILEQTTAIDVIAIGLQSGKILLYNIKLDKILHTFRHDSSITNIAFRDDGVSTMASADDNGTLAFWNLEKQELIGKIVGIHSDAVNCLHFVAGEPIMISASIDNSLRVWIFDNNDRMPRELVKLEGHSLSATSVHFVSKTQLLSAGVDGSILKYDVSSPTMRHKFGSVSVSSRKKSASESKELRRLSDLVVGWQREAAWNNVFCRQENDTKITAFQSRNNTRGSFVLEHGRFKSNAELAGASATSLCLSPCGNYVFVGYSTGHIDQFNAQSGRHIHSYTSSADLITSKRIQHNARNGEKKLNKKHCTVSNSKITSLSVDKRGKSLMSTDEAGNIIFWSLSTRKLIAKLFKNSIKLGISTASPVNSLVAVVTTSENNVDNVVLIDTVCHQVVRIFEHVDNQSHIRVFDISSSNLIDVLLFSKPCISISVNDSGEFIATAHEGERAVYVWANKAMFLSQVNIRVFDEKFVPSWEAQRNAPDVCIDDDEEDILDFEIRSLRELQIDENMITLSGLPRSRWANLPDLALIKKRNKPENILRKAHNTPFFLSAAPTIDGFEFQNADSFLSTDSSVKHIQSKRSLLEAETLFSTLLGKAKNKDNLLNAFYILKEMSVSSIDFQIQSLAPTTVPVFLRMLLEVLKTKTDFDLVQAFTASALKAHRSLIWKNHKSRTDEMLRSLAYSVTGQAFDVTSHVLVATTGLLKQQRGRRRSLAPVPWLSRVRENVPPSEIEIKKDTRSLLDAVVASEALSTSKLSPHNLHKAVITDIPEHTRRVVGKRKAFNRNGAMWRVTVGAGNSDPNNYSLSYRRQFLNSGTPVKEKLGCFLVTEDVLPSSGTPLDARHFTVGQYVTATGKSIDWGFQGGMHRWGMRGQPTRRTTKSHRRIGSVGSVGDARIWPGKRMPGHMGHEWKTVSGLEIIRINIDKQVIYVKGSTPGDIGEILLLKDCLQEGKRLKSGPVPTWTPSLESIPELTEENGSNIPKELLFNEMFSPKLFRFTSPSIVFTDADAKKTAGRDKTKAKIAKRDKSDKLTVFTAIPI